MSSPLGRFRLEDRVAVVTGASRGIGEGVARAFAAVGARVVVASRSAERCEAVAGELPGAVAVPTDVTSEPSLDALFARTQQLGGADVFVHCAGVAGAAPALDATQEQLRAMLDVHYLAGVAGAQRAARQMRAKERGAILLVTSIWGLGASPATLAYGAAKAALAHAVKVLALEWARYGVRVNGLAPGSVETDMTEGIDARVRERLTARVPLRRFATVDEMVGPALFLCSDAASYVSGHVLVADGGERAR